MQDDKMYLGDLTKRCEDRANDYDQQSQMRGSEVSAITQALDILENKVKSKDEAANERALLQKASLSQDQSAPDLSKGMFSFLQTSASTASSKAFLQRSVVGVSHQLSQQATQQRVVAFLRGEGSRLGSTVLATLTLRAAADPFGKVKKLIQDLIERLVSESTAEATKKGFCDTEMGKSNKDKQFRMQAVSKLNAAVRSLEVKQEELELELEELAIDLKQLKKDLVDATEIRREEKAENEVTIKDARTGLTAVSEAILLLKVFYKQAAKASFVQASPVDEDAPDVAEGSYAGKQDSSKAIIGLLEVIQSDFQRTLSTTVAAEKDSAAEFVEFERASKADIEGKETKTELDEQDLEVAKVDIKQNTRDMEDNMSMLDSALKELEELKPLCIDSGMSYEERVEKREEEIDALKKALCMLDPEGVESECS